MANIPENAHCLKTPDAAIYLGVSESWLRQRRMTGNLDGKKPSPPYVRYGRSIRYLKTALDRFLSERSVND